MKFTENIVPQRMNLSSNSQDEFHVSNCTTAPRLSKECVWVYFICWTLLCGKYCYWLPVSRTMTLAFISEHCCASLHPNFKFIYIKYIYILGFKMSLIIQTASLVKRPTLTGWYQTFNWRPVSVPFIGLALADSSLVNHWWQGMCGQGPGECSGPDWAWSHSLPQMRECGAA